MATSTANIVRLLIRYQNLLWTVRKKILALKLCMCGIFVWLNQLLTNHHYFLVLMEYISVMCLSYPDPQVHYESGQAPKYGKSEEAKRESRTEAAEEDSH